MAEKLILDALIPREDFDVEEKNENNLGQSKTTLSITDLEYDSFFFSAIRKPDFQRETNEWTPEKVKNLIISFLDGELIPALILWRNQNNYIFVIDGSHRLSALAAWINDDYGDGEISRKYYGGEILEEQKKIAEETRRMINEEIGSFEEYKKGRRDLQNVSSKVIERVKRLGALGIQIQWVEGDSKKAEESFFKINQQGSPINPTEIMLIKSRTKANGLASRAIIRAGKGHNYWANFGKEKQEKIQDLAEQIHNILFKPNYETPIKTLNLPIAGPIISSEALTLVSQTVNIINGIKEKEIESLPEDISGDITIKYLNNTLKILRIIHSTHPSSLGLYPIAYFYSMRGRHKIASFYAIVDFVMYLKDNNRFSDFIKVRPKFENILVNYEYLVQEIVRKYRQSKNGYTHIKDYYVEIMEFLLLDISEEEAIQRLVNSNEFSYLSKTKKEEEIQTKKFSTERKSAVYIVESLKNANRCAICGGYIDSNALTIDHIVRARDGGKGSVENGQLAHPYCNSTYKN